MQVVYIEIKFFNDVVLPMFLTEWINVYIS